MPVAVSEDILASLVLDGLEGMGLRGPGTLLARFSMFELSPDRNAKGRVDMLPISIAEDLRPES